MENVIKHLELRGFIDAVTSDEICELVKNPIRIYIGFDPTAESLHLGNLVGIIALRWFEKFGHDPVALIGGATGKIGDPSGKSEERPLLDSITLDRNVAAITGQLKGLLETSQVLNNEDWFSKMSVTEFLRDIGKQFRLGPMLGKESVRARVQSEEGMSFTEFSYQLLQGYDFCHLAKEHGVVLQSGGSDQWGNITAGIEYTRKVGGPSVGGFTFPLLTRSDGKKFGKSEGGAIWLSSALCSPYKFYQYLVRICDADVGKMMRMLTFMDLEEIEQYEAKIASGSCEPNCAQRRLAEEVTLFVHGKAGVEIAKRVTESVKPGSNAVLDIEVLREIASDMPSAEMDLSEVVGKAFVDIAVLSGLVKSKGEAVRLIQNGGGYLNNQKISDPKRIVEKDDLVGDEFLLFGSGKKRKLLIKIKK
jgi:tyrosyl-tRNA synthetase